MSSSKVPNSSIVKSKDTGIVEMLEKNWEVLFRKVEWPQKVFKGSKEVSLRQGKEIQQIEQEIL
jgi:hypothetical protein